MALNPTGVDYGEFGAAHFGGELGVGEWSGVRLGANALLEVFEIFETEDLTAAHEVDDLASGAIDGVHTDEVGFFINSDRIETVVYIGLHGVECVVGVTEWPAFVVGEDCGDVVELRGREVWARVRRLSREK